MTTTPPQTTIRIVTASPLALGEPHIVLKWLARLRWLAAVGQIAAVGVAVGVLKLELNLVAIVLIIGLTVVTNAALEFLVRWGKAATWVTALTVVLDVLLLTGLLYFCGGPVNPFCVLYVIHVVMAVVALGTWLTWAIVAECAACYAGIVATHVPLPPLDDRVIGFGQWAALVLVAMLIAYFVGRITLALRQREIELAGMRERATRSEMLASLTTLAAGAAHELGTPMGTIAIAARELELALEQYEAMRTWADDARLIRSEVDRCRNILERMRVDVSDELRLRPAQISIEEFVDLLRQDLAAAEWSSVRVSGVTPEIVRLPSRAMRQALNVLLRNALEVTPPGQVVELRVHRTGQNIAFEVEDHGPGMEPEVARRAGEPFFTTKPVGKGMGMGLFLVRMVAEQTKGAFSLDSTPGIGTRSVLSLPIPDGSGKNEPSRLTATAPER
jgi:two-component system sensor histidine kinase RegB